MSEYLENASREDYRKSSRYMRLDHYPQSLYDQIECPNQWNILKNFSFFVRVAARF